MAKKNEPAQMAPAQAEEFARLNQQLAAQLSNYEKELDALEEIKSMKTSAEERVEALKNSICASIMDIEDRFGVSVAAASADYKYTVGRKTYYNVPAESKDFVVRSLRHLGWAELIQTRVDPRTLTKALQEVTAEDGSVPRRYRALVANLGTYDKNTLTRRRK